jgi:PKD repeat protein
VTFVNGSTNASSFLWSFGDGTTGSAVDPSHSYIQPGVYTVTLVASDGVVTDTLSRGRYIKAYGPNSLQANFTASPISGTVPLTVTFLNSSINATSFLWNFGDGLTSIEINSSHSFTQAGIYTVTLAASDGVMTDTLVKPNYITAFQP